MTKMGSRPWRAWFTWEGVKALADTSHHHVSAADPSSLTEKMHKLNSELDEAKMTLDMMESILESFALEKQAKHVSDNVKQSEVLVHDNWGRLLRHLDAAIIARGGVPPETIISKSQFLEKSEHGEQSHGNEASKNGSEVSERRRRSDRSRRRFGGSDASSLRDGSSYATTSNSIHPVQPIEFNEQLQTAVVSV